MPAEVPASLRAPSQTPLIVTLYSAGRPVVRTVIGPCLNDAAETAGDQLGVFLSKKSDNILSRWDVVELDVVVRAERARGARPAQVHRLLRSGDSGAGLYGGRADGLFHADRALPELGDSRRGQVRRHGEGRLRRAGVQAAAAARTGGADPDPRLRGKVARRPGPSALSRQRAAAAAERAGYRAGDAPHRAMVPADAAAGRLVPAELLSGGRGVGADLRRDGPPARDGGARPAVSSHPGPAFRRRLRPRDGILLRPAVRERGPRRDGSGCR